MSRNVIESQTHLHQRRYRSIAESGFLLVRRLLVLIRRRSTLLSRWRGRHRRGHRQPELRPEARPPSPALGPRKSARPPSASNGAPSATITLSVPDLAGSATTTARPPSPRRVQNRHHRLPTLPAAPLLATERLDRDSPRPP